MRRALSIVVLAALLVPACASRWKIHGGPAECLSMCKAWNLEFAGMVGVGNQEATGPGATACVCQVARQASATAQGGGAASSASLAGPIVAAEAAAAAQAAMQVQQQQQQQRAGGY
jgi:hypothetical protein